MAVYNYLLNTGVVVPDTATIQAEVEQEFKQIFGDDFITDPETPEGAWISAEVTSRQSVARNNVQVSNQLNPNIAGGTFFDSIWALTGGARDRATFSTVQLTVTGVAGTVIPEGSRASDTTGNEWLSQSEIVISVSGSAVGSFRAENTGPIAASANTITTIVDNSVLGWETVNNTSAAILGKNTQSDVSSRRQRKREIALQGRSTAVAISSNLAGVPGVNSHSFRENVSDQEQDIDGVTLKPKSIWAAVDGGADSDIAVALLEAKSSGSDWNGTITVPTVEPESGQTFNVMFQRPDDIDLMIRVTMSAGLGSNPVNQVEDAIINYVNGDSRVGDGFTVGNDASPYEISAAINDAIPSSYVRNIELAMLSQNPDYGTATIPIAIDEIARLERANIEVIFS